VKSSFAVVSGILILLTVSAPICSAAMAKVSGEPPAVPGI
jgi:hypothetical protein